MKIKATMAKQRLGIDVKGLFILNKSHFKYNGFTKLCVHISMCVGFMGTHIMRRHTTLHCILALIVTYFCTLFGMVCRVLVEP